MFHDISYLLMGVLNDSWRLLPLLLLALLVQSSWYKKILWKQKVSYWIKKYLDPNTYYPVRNVVLPTEYGNLVFDYIIVSVYGVFVIETIYLPGMISGGENDLAWKRRLNGKETELKNLSKVIGKHARLLAKLLRLSKDKVNPILICLGECEFGSQMSDYIVQDDHFVRYILSSEKLPLTVNDVQNILGIINSNQLPVLFKKLSSKKRKAGNGDPANNQRTSEPTAMEHHSGIARVHPDPT